MPILQPDHNQPPPYAIHAECLAAMRDRPSSIAARIISTKNPQTESAYCSDIVIMTSLESANVRIEYANRFNGFCSAEPEYLIPGVEYDLVLTYDDKPVRRLVGNLRAVKPQSNELLLSKAEWDSILVQD